MSTFVLVHGAYHGGWAWDKIVPLLEDAGHEVEAPDLPGHGQDETPIAEITLQRYVERIVQELDSRPEPVILVGHSLGGTVISEAAEQRPDKVETLVYVNAFLLPSGTSIMDKAQQDTESLAAKYAQADEDWEVTTIPKDMAKETFYGDCSEEDAAWAIARIQAQAVAPSVTPISVTEGNFGRVPRVYVTCLHDRSNTPDFQKKMYTETPCREVISLQTDHSPFLSAPEELAGNLISLAPEHG